MSHFGVEDISTMAPWVSRSPGGGVQREEPPSAEFKILQDPYLPFSQEAFTGVDAGEESQRVQ